MRANDLAYPHIERADRIFDLSGREDFAQSVLSLTPAQSSRLTVVPQDAALDDLDWSAESFALCLLDAQSSSGEERRLHRVLEHAPQGMVCLVLLQRLDLYLQSLLDPLSRAGWAAKALVRVANRSLSTALLASRSSREEEISLRMRNEYVLLQHQQELHLARIQELEANDERQREALRELQAAQSRAQQREEQLQRDLAGARRQLDGLTASLTQARLQADSLNRALDRERAQKELMARRWKRALERIEVVRGSWRFRFGDAFFQAYRRPKDMLARLLPTAQGGPDEPAARGGSRRQAPSASPEPEPPASDTRPPAAREHAGAPSELPSSATTPSAATKQPGESVQAVSVPGITLAPTRAPTSLRQLRVAAILDEMSERCFAPECELVQFTPNTWERELAERPPHLLLVESAWKGNGGSWQYKVGRYNHPDAGGLAELVRWCNQQSIPTVFWNKEDPVHFDKFKHSAALFDVVLTTDSNVTERYETLPNSRIQKVGTLPFAAQPLLHNPVFAGPRAPEPCFAGSYYGNRHPDRRAQQEMLLDAATEHGLVIYDRNFGSEAPEFQFPERFRPHIKGRLPYEALSRVYKQHRIFLNVNSVTSSPTMMSRRVYELLASGTPVVSTPSLAIESTFGDLVLTVENAREASEALSSLLSDRDAWSERSRGGVRFVMAAHTYADRLRLIADALDLCPGLSARPAITVAAVSTSRGSTSHLVDWVLSQVDAPVAEILLGSASDAEAGELRQELQQRLDADGSGERIRGRAVKLDTGGAGAYRELAALAKEPWVLISTGTLSRDRHLLADLAHATQYTRASIIGNAATTRTGEPAEQSYTDSLAPGAILVDRSLLRTTGWPPGADDDHLLRLRREGALLFGVR